MTVEAICGAVARELIPDRATLQVGVGSTSGALMSHLTKHHDLGMQTEIIPWGTTNLVRDGVMTGKYKKLFPGWWWAVASPSPHLAINSNMPTAIRSSSFTISTLLTTFG